MIAFRRAPGLAGGAEWPLLDVYLDPEALVPQTCIVDSGAAGIRLSADLAAGAGVGLPAEPNGPDAIAGGVRSQTYRARVPLTVALGDDLVRWTAPVAFCRPWPHPFGLLGHEGFFDAFDVLLIGRDRRFACTARGDSP